MKKLIALAALMAAALILSPLCPAQKNKKNDDPRLALAVKRALDAKEFTVTISRAESQSGYSGDYYGYTLTVKDGKVTTRLPYFGSGDSAAAYGSDGDKSIVFENTPAEDFVIDASKVEKRGRYYVSFKAKSGSNMCDVDITVWNNATVLMSIRPGGRTAMSYDGALTGLTLF